MGDGTIVATRAVVTKDVPPYAVVAGNPARIVRHRYDEATVARLLAGAWWHWGTAKITRHLAAICGPNLAALKQATQPHFTYAQGMSSPDPLILTLTLDAASQDFFDEQRRRYFPPSRNHLGAHLTLFHALPGAEEASISAYLSEQAAAQAPLELAVAGVKFMGRGVMYALDCPPLQALHRGWQQHWQPWLTPQDQQGLRPHITVQNKVDPAEARALHAQLAAAFAPSAALGTGLALWAYRGGPWEARQQWPFGGAGR